jgi:hypothetical protein
MAEQSTYIKIDRNIMRWRWFKNKNTLIVFLWLLLNANVTDHEFEHTIIHRGEVATSLATIGKSTTLTIQEVRTAILHLKSTGEITSRSCNRYQVISIVNYNSYQDVPQAKQQRKQQAINKQSTGNQQQYKNDKHDKHERINKGRSAPPSPYGGLERGTDAFRSKSHLLLKADEGTVDDIPTVYRDGTYNSFDNFADYWRWRNQ